MEAIFSNPISSIAAGFIFLLVAGYFEFRTFRVPNSLVLTGLIFAFIFAIVAGILEPDRSGSVVSTLVGMFVGGLVLLPAYAMGGLGAGCVKAQAVFGAWVGAGLTVGICLKAVFVASLIASIVAVFCYMMFRQMESAKSDEQKFRLMHGQLPLAIGSMIGLTFFPFF